MPDSTTRLVVLILGLVALCSIAGAVYLVATDHQIPDFLVATGTSSITGVAALLVRPDDLRNDAGQAYWGYLLVFVIGFILGVLCHANGVFV